MDSKPREEREHLEQSSIDVKSSNDVLHMRKTTENTSSISFIADEKLTTRSCLTYHNDKVNEEENHVAQAKDSSVKGTSQRRSSRDTKGGKGHDEKQTIVDSITSQEKVSFNNIDVVDDDDDDDDDDDSSNEEEQEEDVGSRQNTTAVIPSRTVSITSTTLNFSPSKIAQRKDQDIVEEVVNEPQLRRPSRQEIEERQTQAAIDSFGSDYRYRDVPVSSSSSTHPDITSMSKDVNSSANHTSKLTSEQIDFSKNYVMRPCSRDERALLCYIERDRSGFNYLYPVYRLYIEPSNSSPKSTAAAANHNHSAYPIVEGSRFMMSAKKKVGSKTSYYLVSLDHTPDMENRGSKAVLGKNNK